MGVGFDKVISTVGAGAEMSISIYQLYYFFELPCYKHGCLQSLITVFLITKKVFHSFQCLNLNNTHSHYVYYYGMVLLQCSNGN